MNKMVFSCWIKELKVLFYPFGDKVQPECWVVLYVAGFTPVSAKEMVERYIWG